jgi:PAS domain S-box-containing protein
MQSMLEGGIEGVSVTKASGGREALSVLAAAPQRFLVVVIDTRLAEMDLGNLITGIKQTNPAIEIIVLSADPIPWRTLTLPRQYRPVIMTWDHDANALVSCVAKLLEIIETKEDYAMLSQRIRRTASVARYSTDALLGSLHRQNRMGMIGMRRDGFFLSCNNEAKRITGYSLSDLAHIQAWAQTLVLDYSSARQLLNTIQLAWSDGLSREILSLPIRTNEGSVTNLSVTLLLLPDETGLVRQLVMLFYDPAESSRTAEYDALLKSGSSALYSYLTGHGFCSVSRPALDLINGTFRLDLVEDDLLHRPLCELPLPFDTVKEWWDFLEGVASGRIPEDHFPPPMGPPGRTIIGHRCAIRVPGEFGDAARVVGELVAKDELQSDSFRNLSGSDLREKVVEGIPMALLILRAVRDDRGRILDFQWVAGNRMVARLLCVDGDPLENSSLTEIITDVDARSAILVNSAHVTETGRDANFDCRFGIGPGRATPALLQCWAGKVGDGVVLLFQDVTAKRAEEEKLKHYRHLFLHSQEAIIVTDLEGRITDWNPASELMFGYRRSEILGQSAVILTQNRRGDQLEQGSREVLREGDVWRGEYEFVRADGTPGVASSVFTILKDDEGKAYGTVGICFDLTERKRFEEMLTAKSQELQEKNLALNTLLRHAEAERVRACEEIALDFSRRVNEGIQKILQVTCDPKLVEVRAALLLQDVGGARTRKEISLDDRRLKLSDKELEVAQLIRLGKSTREIAFMLGKSLDTIRLQRISIRKKLGVKERGMSLSTRLKSLDLW